MEKNKVRLVICGNEYNILTDEDVKYVSELGDEVDEKLTKLMRESSRISVTQGAVLLALEYADEARKATESASNLRSQITQYLEDSARAKTELQVAHNEITSLTRELSQHKKGGNGLG